MVNSENKHLVGKQSERHQQGPPAALHTRLLQLLLSHGGMFMLVSFVAAFGAWIFTLLERPYENAVFDVMRQKVINLNESENYLIKQCWFLGGQNISFETFQRKIGSQLMSLQAYTLDMANNYGYDGSDEDTWTNSWNFANALLFTVTIMTTIGYGHIAPKTIGGQMFTIMYAMIGTPLLLVFLANIGDGMARIFTLAYSRLCCRWCRSERYQQLRKPGKRAKRVSEDEIGKEEYMPTAAVHVPITINLMLIALYLGLGAAIFARWEEWEFLSAYYFSFVTLSTIGFGDMVPGNSFIDRTEKSGFTKAIKMGITIAYCLIGMALISMCIQVMQAQIIDKVHWAGQEMGLILDKEMPQRRLRRTRRCAAPETKYLQHSLGSKSADLQRQQRRRDTAQRREEREEREEREREEQQQGQPEERQQSEEQPERQTPQLSDSDEDIFNLA